MKISVSLTTRNKYLRLYARTAIDVSHEATPNTLWEWIRYDIVSKFYPRRNEPYKTMVDWSLYFSIDPTCLLIDETVTWINNRLFWYKHENQI